MEEIRFLPMKNIEKYTILFKDVYLWGNVINDVINHTIVLIHIAIFGKKVVKRRKMNFNI